MKGKKKSKHHADYDFDRETLTDNMLLKKELEKLKRYNRRWKAVNAVVIAVMFVMMWALIFLVI